MLTRLAISSLEKNVSREEVYKLIQEYERKGIIPPDQTVEKVIERAWFVASKSVEGISSSDAHKMFRKGGKSKINLPITLTPACICAALKSVHSKQVWMPCSAWIKGAISPAR